MEYVICFRCWETVEKMSNRQKFCHECAVKVHAESRRRWIKKYRKLGTTGFHEHPCKDFDKEYNYIQREKKKLGF